MEESMPIWINGTGASNLEGMDSAGENGQGESAQGRESVIWDRRYVGTCSQGVPYSESYNHTIATTCQRKPCVRSKLAAATISAIILPTAIVMRCLVPRISSPQAFGNTYDGYVACCRCTNVLFSRWPNR